MQNLLETTFAHPRGVFGRLGGALMARSAKIRDTWTLSLLTVAPDAHVLEVGFGPGTLIQSLAAQVPSGSITGIDSSPVMLHQASMRNQRAIQEQRVHLQLGSAVTLPFADSTFDVVFSANSIFFWPDKNAGVQEIQRVLKPDGMLVLILQPVWVKTADEVQTIGAEYMTMLTTVDFRQVHSAFQPMRPVASVGVLGIK